MRIVTCVQLGIVAFVIGCWLSNFCAFVDMDFEAPYNAEIIHGVGLVFGPGRALGSPWYGLRGRTIGFEPRQVHRGNCQECVNFEYVRKKMLTK